MKLCLKILKEFWLSFCTKPWWEGEKQSCNADVQGKHTTKVAGGRAGECEEKNMSLTHGIRHSVTICYRHLKQRK